MTTNDKTVGERFCNKCGYWGPDVLHQRPNGSGQCGYLSCLTTPSKEPAGAVAAMPATTGRRPHDDAHPEGYLESDQSWAMENWEAVRWLADNHVAIRRTLAAPGAAIDAREQSACAKCSSPNDCTRLGCAALASRPEAPPASASPATVAQPAFFASPEQANALQDRPGDNEGGVYLPVRKTEAGKFTMPLYAAQPCPSQGCGVEGEALDAQSIMFLVYEYAQVSEGIDAAEGEKRTEQRRAMQAKGAEIRSALASLTTPSKEPAGAVADESFADRERELSFQAFQTIRPPMTRIAGVSPGVLERAAKRSLAAPGAAIDAREQEVPSSHVPLPWSFRRMKSHVAIEASNGVRVAELRWVSRPDGSTTEDVANFIIQQVNK
ncbi:hypothetical protein J2W35_003232 [Variovorax boronicumulans]|uniref:hypothetical protein n=1 Tax=Variovorax boronicumulans TaxID=436515 RepID=UPI00277F8667|nr:hypothetical protein [Variovorax boronicumulans]MDQ0082873.1 hypothetical protein [Variovorax boronicumulans]